MMPPSRVAKIRAEFGGGHLRRYVQVMHRTPEERVAYRPTDQPEFDASVRGNLADALHKGHVGRGECWFERYEGHSGQGTIRQGGVQRSGVAAFRFMLRARQSGMARTPSLSITSTTSSPALR